MPRTAGSALEGGLSIHDYGREQIHRQFGLGRLTSDDTPANHHTAPILKRLLYELQTEEFLLQ